VGSETLNIVIREIEEKLVARPKEKTTSISQDEARFIYEFLKKHDIKRTMEVGFAYGYSAACIIAATGSDHVAIDPFQSSFDCAGMKNLKALGYEHRCELREQPSHVALPELLKEGRRFQFIFVDGGHRFDDIFTDWYFSDLLLEKNGYVLFHDLWMRSTQMVAAFIQTNRADYRAIPAPLKNLVLFQKGDRKDERSWDHFEEFYNTKSAGILDKLMKRLPRARPRKHRD